MHLRRLYFEDVYLQIVTPAAEVPCCMSTWTTAGGHADVQHHYEHALSDKMQMLIDGQNTCSLTTQPR